MIDSILDRALDEIVERCDDLHGDWEDVLRRAQVARGGNADRAASRPPRRLVLPAVVLAAVLAVVLATPAFGLRSLLLDVLGGRTTVPFRHTAPAPPIVRRYFADLGFGAPPSMNPQAIVGESRTVGTFRVRGKPHTLWVAPTRRDGFCWQFSEASSGCLSRRDLARAAGRADAAAGAIHPELLSISYLGVSATDSTPAQLAGVVVATDGAQVTASFRDGRSIDIPFVYVSAPIRAGFLLWEIPKPETTATSALAAISVRSKRGKVLARAVFPRSTLRRPRFPVHPTHVIRQKPPGPLGFHIPAPTAPLQHGSGDGAAVTLGANGVAAFDTAGISPARRALLRGGLGVGCFRIEHDQLGIWPRELLDERGFGSTIKVRLFGLSPPLDGCEIQASYGHTWPDRLGSHSAVEIPLTPTGRTYFADRAAARDLALFVRSRRGHALRREHAAELKRELATIGPRLTALPAPTATPPAGKIGYFVASDGVRFVERSVTGKRFQVIVRAGRIRSENVKPYAFVF